MTLFPEMIRQGLGTSIIGRGIERGFLSVEAVNIRDYAFNKHHSVDDYTYGGGAGMLMQAEPVYQCYCEIKRRIRENGNDSAIRCVYLTPQGRVFDQALAAELSEQEDLILLCGHYEGIDERVLEEIVTDHISIGDYVLTGGELAAMVVTDAVARLIPGVLNNETSSDMETFKDGLLEYPQYTRPEVWHGKEVPKILLSGHHENVEKWRKEQSLQRTKERRPDLLLKRKK